MPAKAKEEFAAKSNRDCSPPGSRNWGAASPVGASFAADLFRTRRVSAAFPAENFLELALLLGRYGELAPPPLPPAFCSRGGVQLLLRMARLFLQLLDLWAEVQGLLRPFAAINVRGIVTRGNGCGRGARPACAELMSRGGRPRNWSTSGMP